MTEPQTKAPLPEPAQALRMLREAQMIRSAALADVVDGRLTAEQLIFRACDPDQPKALMRISLRELLASQPDWTLRAAAVVCQRIEIALGEKPTTIAWLVDRRTGGKRWHAYLDATTERQLPWDGFPWATNEQGKQ